MTRWLPTHAKVPYRQCWHAIALVYLLRAVVLKRRLGWVSQF